MVILSVKDVMETISKMKTKEEIINYCDKLSKDGLFKYSTGSDCCDDDNGFLSFILIGNKVIETNYGDEIPPDMVKDKYILMRRIIDDPDADYNKLFFVRYYFFIDFDKKEIIKCTDKYYNCSYCGESRTDITKDMTLKLSI